MDWKTDLKKLLRKQHRDIKYYVYGRTIERTGGKNENIHYMS